MPPIQIDIPSPMYKVCIRSWTSVVRAFLEPLDTFVPLITSFSVNLPKTVACTREQAHRVLAHTVQHCLRWRLYDQFIRFSVAVASQTSRCNNYRIPTWFTRTDAIWITLGAVQFPATLYLNMYSSGGKEGGGAFGVSKWQAGRPSVSPGYGWKEFAGREPSLLTNAMRGNKYKGSETNSIL